MAKLANQATIKNASSKNITSFEVSHADFMTLLSTIETMFTRDKQDRINEYSLNTFASNMIQSQVYWAVRSKLNNFPIAEDFDTVVASANGWYASNEYDVADIIVNLNYQKEQFDKNNLNLHQAMVMRLMKAGHKYGLQGDVSRTRAIEVFHKMNTQNFNSEHWEQLKTDGQIKMDKVNDDNEAIWNEVVAKALTEYPDDDGRFNDVEPQRLYLLTQDISKLCGNLIDWSNAEIDWQDLANVDTDWIEKNRASFRKVQEVAEFFVKQAEQINNTNVNPEMLDNHLSETQNLEEPAGFQHKDYNEGYVTP